MKVFKFRYHVNNWSAGAWYGLLLMALFCCPVMGQETSITAALDTNAIVIGDQVKLTLLVSKGQGHAITWPVVPDSIGKVEVVSRGKIDTLKEGEKLVYRQSLVLTSFDSGTFVLPAFRLLYKKEKDTTAYTSESLALSLQVHGIAVDTSKEIKDIKEPLEVPFSWKEFLRDNAIYIGGGILAIAAALAFYFWWRRRKKAPVLVKETPKVPAHEIALQQLATLEKQKLWQQGDYKTYHSSISDIVRTYIEQRYGVNAMELTSDETLAALRTLLDLQEKERLQQLLGLADQVKFAKALPIQTENELSLRNAYDFINATKLSERTEMKEEVGIS